MPLPFSSATLFPLAGLLFIFATGLVQLVGDIINNLSSGEAISYPLISERIGILPPRAFFDLPRVS